ncbi:asparagine synthase-related protein [Cohnella faecalis]|nr:asparagine synthase-related protein [Cohnella faecalis]
MGSIVGIFSWGSRPIQQQTRENLMSGLASYPADDRHTWQSGSVFLGSCQRWITSESRLERQPYVDESNGLAIVADAILDNREELRRRLAIDAGKLAGIGDGELILEAYRKWGTSVYEYLLGDYAFVIWDEPKRMLFGARDPLGHRTLYYRNDRSLGQFAFCSSMTPLQRLPDANPGLNMDWLAEFLAFPNLSEFSDDNSSPFAGIGKLGPGRYFTLRNGIFTANAFGALLPNETLRLRSDSEYEEAFCDVFGAAVNARLRTFREVGASLSGGLDSGAVAGFAANSLRSEGKVLHTYSYVPPGDFQDWTHAGAMPDERPLIRQTIAHVGNIREEYLSVPGGDPYSDIDDTLALREEPYKFFENAFWVKSIYAQARQDGVGILLTGAQGNHTISWGSAPYYFSYLLKKFRWLKLYREFQQYSRQLRVKRSRLFRALIDQRQHEGERSFPAMIHPEFAQRSEVYGRREHADGLDSLSSLDERAARENHFASSAVRHAIGSSVSALSHRYGLWERDPTSDARVIRFCLALPMEQYVQNGFDRALVRRSLRHILPDSVRLNQRVRGVQGVDWVHRMRASWPVFLAEADAIRRDSAASELFNVEQIRLSLDRIGTEPRPELACDADARFLMQCVIAFRFVKKAIR